MDKTVNNLLSQQLTRREFLIKAGLLLLAITGISGFLKSFSDTRNKKQDSGFGSGTYGR